ncbi:hotdog fold thioesterase [Haloechinothrix sp. LS1_15]|uniref:PaaI family thioesterase n=1 Tax=Haloechinothrix sp. LS1_15 TaxID=2652248 RepID=UPI002945D331|nr:hotdog fold thioesterase [Haloechinothrix sp. LS1_15]MDV6012234.1 hotdog fold thioesterase [Haloechinothrix sp. LS1_15]
MADVPGADPEAADQQLADRMGITITQWDAERVVATMPVAGNLQPYGLLHGGANAVLAETLGSICAGLNAGHGRVAVGLDLHCTHHRAVRDGSVTATAVPIHTGRSTVTAEIVIIDDRGRRTCTARLTCLIRDNAPGSG